MNHAQHDMILKEAQTSSHSLQTDELDKKLALAIQYVCNADGIRVPWDKVGAVMGEGISDGAVIQHLAKLRQRMISLNLSVPPPLRRGGGYAIQTSAGNIGSSSSAGNLGSSSSTLVKKSKKATSMEISSSKAISKKGKEDLDMDKGSDSSTELEKPRSKRVKQDSKGKCRNPKAKEEGSDEDEGVASGTVGGKRKRQPGGAVSSSSKGKEKEDPKTSKPAIRSRRSTIKYGELSESVSDEEYDDSNSEDVVHDIIEEDFVAARATFLRSESSYDESEEQHESSVSHTPKKAGTNGPSKIVVLKIGNSERARNFLEDLESVSGNESDLDSDSQDEHDEVEDDVDEEVFSENVATMDNPQMVNEQAEYEAIGFNQPSGDGLHPFENDPSNAVAMTHMPRAAAHDLTHHTAYHELQFLNSAPMMTDAMSLYVENSSMVSVQGGSHQRSDESFTDQNLLSSGILPSLGSQGGVYDFGYHTSGGQDFAANWINEEGDQSYSGHNQMSISRGIHPYSTATFDPSPSSNSLYVPTRNGSGYNTPSNLNRSGDRGMNVIRASEEVLYQSVGSQYQNYSADHDLSHEAIFPATQQHSASPAISGAVQQVNGPSISNEPLPVTNTTTSNYDLAPSENTSIAHFDSPHAHSAGQFQEDSRDGLGNGDEDSYSMMDAFDFESFDADFGDETSSH